MAEIIKSGYGKHRKNKNQSLSKHKIEKVKKFEYLDLTIIVKNVKAIN